MDLTDYLINFLRIEENWLIESEPAFQLELDKFEEAIE
ncbi:hypothetical protein JOC34_001594 [Virgibacillus halotolerans]|nr:hypothetical protein [Virgibacillus halotolerans]